MTATPASKKRKRKGNNTGEIIDKAIETFMKYRSESEERFLKAEETRWKMEMEQEHKRRREDREHEFRLMQMFMQMHRPQTYSSYEEYSPIDYSHPPPNYSSPPPNSLN